MPSKSPAQARLMRAVAHGWKKPGGGGPTKEVAREFVNADRREKVQGYQFGGRAAPISAAMRRPQKSVGLIDPRQMSTTQPVGPLSQTTGGPGSPRRGGFAPRVQNMPWRGAPPPRAEMGPRRGGFRGGQGGPRGGALAQIMQQLQRQQGGRRGFPGRKGPRVAPPPNKYPGGGNPYMGGRNPMMQMRGRYMGASPTRMLR